MPTEQPSALRRILIMFALITSGEVVFLLPFILARIFRPTFLDVFGLSNFQLGAAFSVYGIVAMASYFAGGPLADRFSARQLMTAALAATSLGGVVLATIPSLAVLTVLYGFWGLTTILLFWSALIRATREWGGPRAQGRAYGMLDGGRGLVAALLASSMVAVFAAFLPVDVDAATFAQRRAALSSIIWIFTGLTLSVAALMWAVLPAGRPGLPGSRSQKLPLEGVRKAMRLPAIWLQAIVVVCAYVGYKSTDDFSLFARDVFGYDDVAAAQIGTITFWVRPLAALGAGLVGDKVRVSRMTMISFAILVAGSLTISTGFLKPGMYLALIITVGGTSCGIYALRGLYFALLQEGRVPLTMTGSAVGVVSVIGFTPDIFMGPLMGYLLDRSPGAPGHQDVFAVLAAFGAAGFIASFLFRRVTREKPGKHGADG